MNIVKELKRKTKSGYSLYLDYVVNGKRKQERTGFVLLNGKDERTRDLNRIARVKFEHIKAVRQREIIEQMALQPLPVARQKINFFEYFEKQIGFRPNVNRGKATLKRLQQFYPATQLPITEITEDFLNRFGAYLTSELEGETPHCYFKYLKQVIKKATKEKLFSLNPSLDVRVSKKLGTPKVALDFEEIKMLYNAECPNEIVKRAFVFSCYTGLRYCDVSKLTWKNITSDNFLHVVQSKTKHVIKSPLNEAAFLMCGDRKDDDALIFPLPTDQGTNKNIKKWAKNAGIDKKITFHCARHSFGTNLYSQSKDLLITAKAMGHKSLKETPRYISRVEEAAHQEILRMLSPQ